MEYNGYRITALNDYSMVKIQPKGSGDIPQALSGLYTTREFAKKAIDHYLSNMVTSRKRKKVNDTKERTLTD